MKKYSYIDFLAEFGVRGAHPGGMEATKYIMQKTNLKKGAAVLDVGCGTGETACYLSNQHHFKVCALEKHPIMLKKAKERFEKESPTIQLVAGSIENMPFEQNRFDLILVESVLSFVEARKALVECFRVLKKNGTLIINEMTLLDVLSQEEVAKIKQFYQLTGCFNEQEWKQLLVEAGFKQIEKCQVSLTDNDKVNELELSPNMDLELFDILDEHDSLLEEFKGRMGNVVLFSRK
ncbi:class I SAM-dependent methyltransferase [Halalkalibacter akibai]|uniref:SAM-dependent methyltransferases n=1 Tax=Halalkalibacter akibai (strain ATCC 43226 / DSM 21942 / CIP 109018 / JCM 9157 / 1139) TaxID=1236973 RepID=W4QQD8_HALA3|nr:class I SAM-dependent methyltransferase [Halalkalibacter akibai]GAE34296.1 SAM-dependent methyltransferases [Halalkalibacter akibai JCM 9157]